MGLLGKERKIMTVTLTEKHSALNNIPGVDRDSFLVLKKLAAEHDLEEPLKTLAFLATGYFTVLSKLKSKNVTISNLRELIFGTGRTPKAKSAKVEDRKKIRKDKEEQRNQLQGEIPTQHEDCYVEIEAAKTHTCPKCLSKALYNTRKREKEILDLQSALLKKQYTLHDMRCSVCGHVEKAKLPLEAEKSICGYSPKLSAHMALSRFAIGLPYYRQYNNPFFFEYSPSEQDFFRVSQQVVEKANPVIEGLYKILVNDCKQISIDDTHHDGIFKKEGDEKAKKHRLHPTVMSGETKEGHTVVHVDVSEQTAGKSLSQLLKTYRDLSQPGTVYIMSDALNANNVKLPKESKLNVIQTYCHTHCFRYFQKAAEYHPSLTAPVMKNFGLIYKHEVFCKELNLSDEERFELHWNYSRSRLIGIGKYLENLQNNQQLDEGSKFFDAVKYFRNNYRGLLACYDSPGLYLHNNHIERLIKVLVIHRRNSKRFVSSEGMRVGSGVLSIYLTCEANNINPKRYLESLLLYDESVAENPKLWMPWNYHKQLE